MIEITLKAKQKRFLSPEQRSKTHKKSWKSSPITFGLTSWLSRFGSEVSKYLQLRTATFLQSTLSFFSWFFNHFNRRNNGNNDNCFLISNFYSLISHSSKVLWQVHKWSIIIGSSQIFGGKINKRGPDVCWQIAVSYELIMI